jgi:hypothetical protein
LTFPVGVQSRSVVVAIVGDLIVEPSERFFVRLSDVTGALLADAEGIATIVGDDFPATVTLVDLIALEGDAGILDLTDKDLIVQTDGDNRAADFGALYDELKSGFAGGGWNGHGLASSAAQINGETTLSLVDNAVLGLSHFAGQPVDENSLLVKYTYYGDIDQNGAVDADDLTVFANNFGRTIGATQVDGDLDFNGTVDADDLTVFANNFGKGVGAPLAVATGKDEV